MTLPFFSLPFSCSSLVCPRRAVSEASSKAYHELANAAMLGDIRGLNAIRDFI